MIGKIVSFIALVAVAGVAARKYDDYVPYEGVDPNTLSCDPLATELLLLPSFDNCSQFYMCVHGNEVLMDCAPGGLIFDFELQTCNWAWAIPCVLRKKDDDEDGSGDDEYVSSFSDIINNGPIGELTAEASGTVRPLAALSSRQTNNAVGLNCDHPHTAAKQVAYRGDCQRYWKCVNGVPQTALCSDGLFFNEATMQCDHEANSRCTVETTDELNGEFMIYK